MWNAERNAVALPLKFELPEEPPEQYWADHYYQTMTKLFSPALPRIDPATNASSTQIEFRKKMLSEMTTEKLTALEDHLRRTWTEERQMATDTIRSMLPDEPTPSYWESQYYPTMATFFGYKPDLMGDPQSQIKANDNQMGASQRCNLSAHATSNPRRAGTIAAQDWHATEDGSTTGSSQESEVKFQHTPSWLDLSV